MTDLKMTDQTAAVTKVALLTVFTVSAVTLIVVRYGGLHDFIIQS